MNVEPPENTVNVAGAVASATVWVVAHAEESTTLVTAQVAFVNEVEPIEPVMVDVPPFRTY